MFALCLTLLASDVRPGFPLYCFFVCELHDTCSAESIHDYMTFVQMSGCPTRAWDEEWPYEIRSRNHGKKT